MNDDFAVAAGFFLLGAAFICGLAAAFHADMTADHFVRVTTVCQKNDGLLSADGFTATCKDGARFSLKRPEQ